MQAAQISLGVCNCCEKALIHYHITSHHITTSIDITCIENHAVRALQTLHHAKHARHRTSTPCHPTAHSPSSACHHHPQSSPSSAHPHSCPDSYSSAAHSPH